VLDQLYEQLATVIADYRRGEVPEPDSDHIRRWIGQFPRAVREPLLTETVHVLTKTYIPKKQVNVFLKALTTNEKIVGDDPPAFWRGVRFLRLQQAGNSQRDMLALFDAALKKTCDLSTEDCGAKPHTYVYLDDAVFSGGRVKSDLIRWIGADAPKQAKVAVITMAVHTLGQYFASGDIKKAATAVGKNIEVNWWRAITVEDRKYYMTDSDVLRPTAIPAEARAYVDDLGAAPVLRTGNSTGSLKLFSSGEARNLIEQEFLKAGVEVRARCPLLPAQMRPLGCTLMRTTGFGSMFVTYRNCANNTPLVLWAGHPWYPLFPRRTN
jgi:hypothetical protein